MKRFLLLSIALLGLGATLLPLTVEANDGYGYRYGSSSGFRSSSGHGHQNYGHQNYGHQNFGHQNFGHQNHGHQNYSRYGYGNSYHSPNHSGFGYRQGTSHFGLNRQYSPSTSHGHRPHGQMYFGW